MQSRVPRHSRYLLICLWFIAHWFCLVVVGLESSEQPTSGRIRLPFQRHHSRRFSRRLHGPSTSSLPLVRRTNANTTFNTSLYNDNGSEYLVRVGVGTPPQLFTVALDTGSADLWIPSKTCPEDECPYARFDPSLSSTYSTNKEAFNIVYGSGSASGSYIFESISIGDACVPGQQLGLVNSTKNIILSGNPSTTSVANGILGIGYPELTSSNSGPYDPLVFNLAHQGLISEALFSIYMGSLYEPFWSGEIIFGGTDRSKYRGDIYYAPVAQLGTKGATHSMYTYWMLYGQSVRILDKKDDNDSVVHNIPIRETRGVIIDTGTTLTYMDLFLAEQVVLSLAGRDNVALDETSGVFIVNCSLQSNPQRLEFGFGTKVEQQDALLLISLSVRELIIPLDTDSLENATVCMFGIAPWMDTAAQSLQTSGMILLGDSVLRSLYLVFDMGNNRIGFAPAINSSAAVIPAYSVGDDPDADPFSIPHPSLSNATSFSSSHKASPAKNNVSSLVAPPFAFTLLNLSILFLILL